MQLFRLRSVLSSLLFVFVLGFTVGSAYAVDVNARIKGTVTDPSGAVVPGAAVIATNTATGVKYPTKSSGSGDYYLPQLPVGTYSITVSAPGFKGFTATGITLTIDQEYVEPVKLEVGNTTETLEVAADAVQVNTTDMQLNNIVNSQQMVELPLISRNFTGLELDEPGVQASSDRFGTSSISGGQTQQGEFLINGADANDIALNTLVYTPNLDAIDQFDLIDGPLNAEYDRNSGGIISATIKQGTNHIHGDAFEFYRDTFLNTANFFNHTVATPGSPTRAIVTPIPPEHLRRHHRRPDLARQALGFFAPTRAHVSAFRASGGSANVFSAAQLGGDFTADLDGTRPGSDLQLRCGSHPGEHYVTLQCKRGLRTQRHEHVGGLPHRTRRPCPNQRLQLHRFEPGEAVRPGCKQRHLRLRLQLGHRHLGESVHRPRRLQPEPEEPAHRPGCLFQVGRHRHTAIHRRHTAGLR